jgi:hypothetical protein
MAVGEDSQNRAVGTTLALLERGSRVMSAIHKRCYYSMRQEFRLLHKIFATYLPLYIRIKFMEQIDLLNQKILMIE